MVLEKPQLFLTLKEFWLSMLFLLFLFLIRIFFLHEAYMEFKSKPFFYTSVEVNQAYEKWTNEQYYTVLKVYSPILDISFFTRTKVRVEDLSSNLRLKLFPRNDMKFTDYLGTAFIFSKINEIEKSSKTEKNTLLLAIEKQHENKMIANFYKAIFFATPLDKDLRKQVASLGISHLIALSGFHLAILWGVLFFFIRLVYKPFQQNFFPYRFDLYDIGFIVLLILGFYVWFVGSPPSLIRSYMMMLLGWLLLVFGMELLSFTFLATVVMLLLVVFPKLLLSLAFWFSVMGVFYIFLLLHYFSHLNKYLISLLLSFGIFILMLPIVHMVFPVVSQLQLSSPFLSLGFSIFYPISMGAHLIGIGDIFDKALLKLFMLKVDDYTFLLTPFYGAIYILLTLLSIYSKYIFYLLFLIAFSFSIRLFMGF
jgi:competence protein ComEC